MRWCSSPSSRIESADLIRGGRPPPARAGALPHGQPADRAASGGRGPLARVPSMSGELIRVGDTTVRFLVEGSDSGGSGAVFEAGIRARGRMPAPHSHDGFEETVYGLEGVATWTIDGTAVEVAAGEAVCIPRGAVHHFDNHGDTDAKVLAIITPGVLGPDYFREVAAVFAESSGGPPDLARIGEVMRRHGLTPAAPPARGV